MIVENSELLGEWEKNPTAPNQDAARAPIGRSRNRCRQWGFVSLRKD
jgi:hypothetical protein